MMDTMDSLVRSW